MENRADIQIAQMKNLDKRIEIYKHQLEKLKNINTDSVVAEYYAHQTQTKTIEKGDYGQIKAI